MARYGEAFRNGVVARLLPPESANIGVVAKEIGVSVQTLERWREQVQSRPGRERAWTAGGRLEAVIAAAALDEAGKSVWCREHGVYPADLDKWRLSATTALAEPGEARASPQATRQDKKRIKERKRFTLPRTLRSLTSVKLCRAAATVNRYGCSGRLAVFPACRVTTLQGPSH